MKTPVQLVDERLASPDEHGRRATSLRRLASGLKKQSAGYLGLNQKELKLLTDAAALLEGMAAASAKAKTIASGRYAERQRRERAIREAMKNTFGSIKSVAEKVALIDFEKPYLLAAGEFTITIKDLRSLERFVADALDDLANTLAGQKADIAPIDLVANAWTKFEKARTAIELRHQALIDKLSAVVREGRNT